MHAGVAVALREEAQAANERRLLVLAGDREAGYAAAATALDGAAIPAAETVVISRRRIFDTEHVPPDRAGELLGTTHEAVVVDCHDMTRPNAIGQTVGAVDGGGLYVLVTPPLGSWADRRDAFDERLAVPPATVGAVGGNFRRRLVDTLRSHRGVAIVDVDGGTVVSDGLVGDRTHPRCAARNAVPSSTSFPRVVYDACLTDDQESAVSTMERLSETGQAVVLEADRGRGKSAAAGIAAAALAAEGRDVLVTAPGFRNVRELFARAGSVLADLGEPVASGADSQLLDVPDGGQIRYEPPADAIALSGSPDVVVVDEAAALPVQYLSAFLAAPAVAYVTTVHGYEGAGRGFSVRFRDRIAERDLTVTEATMNEPIRYAAGDPVETWAFRALLLDARPAVDQLVADAVPGDATYVRPPATSLLADEQRLREAFGLLVLAHYRTEPDDLARLLDAPNLSTRLLVAEGRVLAVALLAREGGLAPRDRFRMYAGERVRGNMVPDILTAQLRDEPAAQRRGTRIVRIATHPAVRRRGFGSRLLAEIASEHTDDDWLGAGFGATPALLRFWHANGYRVVHLSTTRNERSGEHSALMLAPLSEDGRTLVDRHAAWFAGRVCAMLTGPLRDVDPEVVRMALAAVETPVDLDLDDHEWRLVAGAAAGSAHLDADPGPFRRVALAHLVDPVGEDLLTPADERLIVARVLQGHSADAVARDQGFPSGRQCMRSFGAALSTLVRQYGPPVASAELDRLD